MGDCSRRPWWCQDKECRPVGVTPGADVVGSESGCCVGRRETALTLERGGIKHVNDAHFCLRTQVRGVVMMEVNKTDFEIYAQAALHALCDYEPGREFFWPWFTDADGCSGASERGTNADMQNT